MDLGSAYSTAVENAGGTFNFYAFVTAGVGVLHYIWTNYGDQIKEILSKFMNPKKTVAASESSSGKTGFLDADLVSQAKEASETLDRVALRVQERLTQAQSDAEKVLSYTKK